jgi:hypothetical protein
MLVRALSAVLVLVSPGIFVTHSIAEPAKSGPTAPRVESLTAQVRELLAKPSPALAG